MENLREVVLDQALLGGASAVGIAAIETLAGGPESTDITQLLPGANSAISFAYALDPGPIDLYLSKKDRVSHERNNLDVNNLASGAALNLAGFIEMKGHKSVPVIANNYYRSDTPGGLLDMLPDAEEVFICNSVRGAIPLTRIGHWEYEIGPVTREVREWLKQQ